MTHIPETGAGKMESFFGAGFWSILKTNGELSTVLTGGTPIQQGHCCPIADIGAATRTKCRPNSDDVHYFIDPFSYNQSSRLYVYYSSPKRRVQFRQLVADVCIYQWPNGASLFS